jgi:MFS family permease
MFLTGVGLFVLWRFFICGFIGALLLALSNTLLGQVLSKKRILLVSIVGGISGMIFVYSFPLENSVLTFAQWHLLVAMAIGLKLPINNSFTTKSYEKTI